MTKAEMMEKLEKLENALFYEEMADFMDWDAYYRLNREIAALKAEIDKA